VIDWIVPALMSLAVALTIGLAVLHARRAVGEGEDATQDAGIYRRQLDEVDRDLARGAIPEEEAGRLRAEIARRLIAADDRAAAAAASEEPARFRPALVVVLVAVLTALPLALYANLGAPGYGDLSLNDRLAAAKERRDTRPDQPTAEAAVPPDLLKPQEIPPADFEVLIQRLRDAVAERPDDLQGQRLLARNEAALGNYRAAYAAQERVLELRGAEAEADDYLTYADMLILAAGGYVSPAAENALRAALARDPENAPARYYMGLMMRQNDRPDVAFRLWDQLLRAGPEDAPWIPPIRAQIDEAAALAGVAYDQPAPADTLSGPTAEDIANAGELSETDRQEMIRGMVSRLSDRLAQQGGSPAEWARLIRAYGVLGDTARARAIASEARQVFAASPEALAEIAAAADSVPEAPTSESATE
jgi:cytochrome c-type biogenesis protein CcmH